MKMLASVAMAAGILACGAAMAASNFVGSHVVQTKNGYTAAQCPAMPAGYARCFSRFVSDASGHPLGVAARRRVGPSAAGPATTSPCQVAGCNSPAQIRAAYGITGWGKSTTTVAIVDAYGYPTAEADLAQFRSDNGLPPCTRSNGCLRIVNQTGGSTLPPVGPYYDDWRPEESLDLSAVSTMCPNCHILLVQATTPAFNNMGTAENTAAAMGAHVISNSYGGGEGSYALTYEPFYNHPGVAITVSTGDDDYYAGPQFPAVSPHVTAVGGTTLNMTGLTRSSEYVWNWEVPFDEAFGTGSGCSNVFAAPYWQAHTYANMANNTLCTGRMEADVSALADPETGLMIVIEGTYYQYGGTSLSAPLIGGIYGERDDTVIYGSNPYKAPSSAFHDITVGNNDNTSCGGLYLCSAKTGYDGPTGLGTPNGDSAF